jgi:hypothetical protein
MKTNPLPTGADLLLAVAESVAAVLADKQEELGMGVKDNKHFPGESCDAGLPLKIRKTESKICKAKRKSAN